MNNQTIDPTTVAINGIDTLIRDAGGDGNTAVVFMHGNPGSGADWNSIAPRVAEFSRVLAPDMPGFGRSEKPADFNYTVEGYASHLDALITGTTGGSWSGTEVEALSRCNTVFNMWFLGQ